MTAINYPLAVGTGVTRIIEAGAGPAVIFVHGLGARCDRWRGTVEAVGKHGYRAITYDLPGHGFASKDADGPSDVPALADHLRSLIAALGVQTAVLVGTSLGAHIAAYAACRDPARVLALGLVGALGIVPIAQQVAETISRNVRATQRAQFVGKLNFVFHDPSMVTDSFIEEEFRMNTAPGASEAFGRIGDYLTTRIAGDYVAAQLRALYPPEKLLLVWGAEDKAVPIATADECQAALGGPKLAIIPNANHVPYVEQPEAFNTILMPFLRQAFGGQV